MMNFIQGHLLLVLTIVAAVISFLASLIGIVFKKKPVVILATLAILGFAVGITYQLYAYNEKQETARRSAAEKQIQEAAQRARDNVIKEINLNVIETKITVAAIADRLKTSTLREIGTELVTIRSSSTGHFEETAAFAKGSDVMWAIYADWLGSVRQSDVAPSLSLTLNGGHQYNSGLLLAYLLTSDGTRGDLSRVINDHESWYTFAAEKIYLKNFKPKTGHLGWVLFYDGSGDNLVAFADAQAFTQELMVYHRLGQHHRIENLLNTRLAKPAEALQQVFSSVRTAVFATRSPADLVRVMIEEQLAVSVATGEKQPYVARLERMIQLAAEG